MKPSILNLLKMPHAAPRKKFRGKRRYFMGVLHKAREFQLDPSRSQWWNCWHYHADWPGYGNLGWKYRLEHIKALCFVYKNCASELTHFGKPFQLWLQLCVQDSGQDAVFIHSANPYKTEFPMDFSQVEWGDKQIEFFFRELLGMNGIVAGVSSWGNKHWIVVYSPEIGVDLRNVD